MTTAERERVRKERDARFAVKLVRCRYCRFIVPERDREGHLGRCEEAPKQGITFARGAPVDEHFTEEER